MDHWYGECVLFVLCALSLVLADPSICYSCSGRECNDPFNVTNASIMTCAGSSFARSSARTGNDWADEDKLFRSFTAYGVASTEYVCGTFVYTSFIANQNMTIRRCVPKTIGDDGACDSINKTVSATIGRVLRCTTCDTDLCNTGVNLTKSLLTTLLLIGSLKILR